MAENKEPEATPEVEADPNIGRFILTDEDMAGIIITKKGDKAE